ncbi:MAG: N-formylglutamate amidohydrolase [Kiloniellales bacterium]|nr:N-formylglutamate amidohydrolase [Kiloniellales bacterium]
MVLSVRDGAEPGLASFDEANGLLSPEDGPPVEVVNPKGAAEVVVACEHAANRIPRALGSLGLEAEALESHIAWDPGAAEVARALARRLDAAAILQRFSRLVHDCNRPAGSAEAVPARSETFEIPGNRGLDAAARKARGAAVYAPFHDALGGLLDRRLKAERRPVLATIHSFVPRYHGRPRKVELGILHDSDPRLAEALLDLAAAGELDVRRNEPYGPADGVTHTLKAQAVPRGLLNVMIEIRSDLVADPRSQSAMAERLAGWLTEALDGLG